MDIKERPIDPKTHSYSRPAQAFQQRLQTELASLRDQDRFRNLRPRQGLDLSSNDYLGLSDHPQIRQALILALEQGIPAGATGSRLLRGNTRWHEDMETRLARFKNSEAALIFNSGYAANMGVLSTLCGPEDTVFSDALNHASLIDGIRASKARKVIFPHNDTQNLEQALAIHQGDNKFIVVESLYSMDGDTAPLQQLAVLADRYNAMLIVDEAHATGLYGQHGAGLCAAAGVVPLVAVHTGGKAWGSTGAFISCSSVVKDYLVNRCRHLIFTTAPPPLVTVQWHAALDVIETEPWRATRALGLADSFRQAMRGYANTSHSNSQIVPLICGSDRDALSAAAQCVALGFDIRAIRPPTVPKGSARLRLAFNAHLSEADTDRLIDGCRTIFKGCV